MDRWLFIVFFTYFVCICAGSIDTSSQSINLNELPVRGVYLHPPTLQKSCDTLTSYDNNTSLPLITTVLVIIENLWNTSIILTWIDKNNIEHPQYIIPAQCTQYIISSYGTAWRAWPSVDTDHSLYPGMCTFATSTTSKISFAKYISYNNTIQNSTASMYITPEKLVTEFIISEALSDPCLVVPLSTKSIFGLPLFPVRIRLYADNIITKNITALLSPYNYHHSIYRIYKNFFRSQTIIQEGKLPDYLINPPIELQWTYNTQYTNNNSIMTEIDTNDFDNDFMDETTYKFNRTEPKAYLYLKYKNLDQIKDPQNTHPGLVMSISFTILEICKPDMVSANFQREEKCPYCHYSFDSITNSTLNDVPIYSNNKFIPNKIATDYIDDHLRYSIINCTYCQGKGILHMHNQHYPKSVDHTDLTVYTFAQQHVHTLCPVCQGIGTTLSKNHTCIYCQNRRYQQKSRKIEFLLPAGASNNFKEVLDNEGGISPGTLPGAFTIQFTPAIFMDPINNYYDCLSKNQNNSEMENINMDKLRVFDITRTSISELYSKEINQGYNNPFIHPISQVSVLGSIERLMEEKMLLSEITNNTTKNQSFIPSKRAFHYRNTLSKISGQLFEYLPVSSSLQEDNEGPHLQINLQITLEEAINGLDFSIITHRGIISLQHLRPPFYPGDVIVVPGGGLPVYFPSFCIWNQSCQLYQGTPPLICSSPDNPVQETKYPSVETLMNDCQFVNSCNQTFIRQWQSLYEQYSTLCSKPIVFPSIQEISHTWNQTIHSSKATNVTTLENNTSENINDQESINSKFPASRTIILCSSLNDTIIHTYPHGHLFIRVNVDIQSTFSFLAINSTDPINSTIDLIQKMYLQSKFAKANPSSKYTYRNRRRKISSKSTGSIKGGSDGISITTTTTNIIIEETND